VGNEEDVLSSITETEKNNIKTQEQKKYQGKTRGRIILFFAAKIM
jgi:hypothetical protein